MVRNVVLAVSSLAILVILFVAYTAFVGLPAEQTATRSVDLPPQGEEEAPKLRIGNELEVPAGGAIEITTYDEHSGQPTGKFSCQDWQPVEGGANEILVSGPELSKVMSGGRVATIYADRGQVGVDRIDQSRMEPKMGWLEGHVRIVIKRLPDAQAAPDGTEPTTLITVEMDRIEFDIELGEMTTNGRVSVLGEDIELVGSGLHLIWNQAVNRVETLTIEHGEKLVLYTVGDLLGPLDGNRGAEQASEDDATSQPADERKTPRRRKERRRRPTAYACKLTGGIVGEQYSGPRRMGSLRADKIDLLFDIGGGGDQFLGSKPTATAPASQPAPEERNRLELHWTGPLHLGPAPVAESGADKRRRLVATGSPVVMTKVVSHHVVEVDGVVEGAVEEARVQCGQVVFHEDSQRIWLYPWGDKNVELTVAETLLAPTEGTYSAQAEQLIELMTPDRTPYIDRVQRAIKLSASAKNIYIDQGENVVKLLGDVELRSGGTAGDSTSYIRSSQWAELHLAPEARTGESAGNPLKNIGQPTSATFVGDVRVDHDEQALLAHRLDIGFRTEQTGLQAGSAAANDRQTVPADQSREAQVETATATGGVRLVAGDGELECSQLSLAFEMGDDQKPYPSRMHAVGAVVLSRQRDVVAVRAFKYLLERVGLSPSTKNYAHIRGDEVIAELAPPPTPAPVATTTAPAGPEALLATRGADGPELMIRSLKIIGRAEFVDADNKIAARGTRIEARFETDNQLATATVSGSDDADGLVYAEPYSVRGRQVLLDREGETLTVDGRSRLAFKSRSSLQGRRRAKPVPIVIDSTKMLSVDGRGNAVRFAGDVVANSGGEQLYGDTLLLLLADVAESPSEQDDTPFRKYRRQLREQLDRKKNTSASGDPFALRSSGKSERLRKEPVRLVVNNALVTRVIRIPSVELPVMESSIRAPLLEVNILQRVITTAGLTQLLMLDRRALRNLESAQAATGVPSALLGDGPSQTAMQCEGRMTYAIGPDGPGRRDTVVFDDAVFFVRRTGQEMVNLDQMLPQATTQPTILDTLRSQNSTLDCDRLECWFEVGGDERGVGLGGAPLMLAQLTASGRVYLRDQEGPRIREVNAAWLEFDRENGLINVRGDGVADARFYFENTESNRDAALTGQTITVDMKSGTIRSDRISGEMRW